MPVTVPQKGSRLAIYTGKSGNDLTHKEIDSDCIKRTDGQRIDA
ncbi:MAG: hypothetical protein ABIR33_07155 [Pyrinomonadaceae bacterium]